MWGLLLLDAWSLQAGETDRPGEPAKLREGISLGDTATAFAFSNVLIPYDGCRVDMRGKNEAAAC